MCVCVCVYVCWSNFPSSLILFDPTILIIDQICISYFLFLLAYNCHSSQPVKSITQFYSTSFLLLLLFLLLWFLFLNNFYSIDCVCFAIILLSSSRKISLSLSFSLECNVNKIALVNTKLENNNNKTNLFCSDAYVFLKSILLYSFYIIICLDYN